MAASVGDLVAQLLAARDRLAEAAVTASRAQADAKEARERYSAAGQGSDHPDIDTATAEIGIAVDKSDKVARLINEVRDHLAHYINGIAPAAAIQPDSPGGLPEGKHLVIDRRLRKRRAQEFLRSEAENDQAKDALQEVEKILTAGARAWQKLRRDGSGPTQATTVVPRHQPAFEPRDRAEVDHPATVVVLAVGAVLVGAKGYSELSRRRRERQERRNDGDQ